ncbi:MAG: hypothetical protein Q4P17_10630 [Methanobacterium sp.]|nr:hypothetical protein [Methanobacterium sp.]
MTLEKLVSERNNILGELKAYEDLQLALEKIKRFNMENYGETTLKVYDTSNDPEMIEITETVVAIKIDELTDYLLKVSENINRIKMGEQSESLNNDSG